VSTFRSFTSSRLAGAVAALWLCGAGAAWAGDGGDLASLNALLSTPNTGLCAILQMKTCPHLPTVTQGILEVAALTNAPPEIVGAQNSITPGSNVTAGNPAAVPPPDHGGVPFPLNSTTVPKLFGVTILSGEPPVPGMLDTLTPIAFASQKSVTAVATQLYDSKADTFLYAVGVSSQGAVGVGGLTNPDTVDFIYDDLFRVAPAFTKGQIVAKFSFPLTVLNNDGTENTAVMTTLKITSCANGLAGCFTANATGDFLNTGSPQTVDAGQLGIQFALVFSASPTSTQKHAIFEVAVPLLVTGACVGNPQLCVTGQPPANTDPPYFFSATSMMPAGQPGNVSAAAYLAGPRSGTFPLNGNFSVYTAFGDPQDDLGVIPTMSGILPATAYSIGLAPTATPFCTAATCPPGNPPPAPPPLSVPFALCASLPDNTNGPAAHLRPAVGAYYAIATDGEMLLSAPVPSVFSACPAL
jgi:hypothetical protein